MPLTMRRLAEKVDKRMRRLSFEMEEALRRGEDKDEKTFLYLKGAFEELESVLQMADPELARGWQRSI